MTRRKGKDFLSNIHVPSVDMGFNFINFIEAYMLGCQNCVKFLFKRPASLIVGTRTSTFSFFWKEMLVEISIFWQKEVFVSIVCGTKVSLLNLQGISNQGNQQLIRRLEDSAFNKWEDC